MVLIYCPVCVALLSLGVHLHQVFGLPLSQVFGGEPLPPSALTLRSAIACEGQKAFINCDDVYSGIQIKSAMYGRQNSTICVDPKRPSSSSSFCQEQEPDVKAQVGGLCQGEYKCEVTAADSLLARRGIAVCPAVSKYLQISYRCIPKDLSADVEEQEPSLQEQTVHEIVGPQGDLRGESAFQDDVEALGPLTPPSPPPPLGPAQFDSGNHVTEVVKSPVATSTSEDDVTEIFSGNPQIGGDLVKEVHETIERSRIEPNHDSAHGFQSENDREAVQRSRIEPNHDSAHGFQSKNNREAVR